MPSARAECPECHGHNVTELSDLLFAPDVDFFGCKRCRHLWHVDKGKEGPAGYALLGPRHADPQSIVVPPQTVVGADMSRRTG